LNFIKNNLSPRAERRKIDFCSSGVLANGLIFIYFNQRCKSERRAVQKKESMLKFITPISMYWRLLVVVCFSLLLPDPDSTVLADARKAGFLISDRADFWKLKHFHCWE